MKISISIIVQLFLMVSLCIAQQFTGRQDFDDDWNFQLNNAKEIAEIKPGAKWRKVSLPHDWSIEGSYSEANSNWESGYLPAGIGWYKKTFNADAAMLAKDISITFDGVYMNSEVWINGHSLGKRPNGYLSVTYNLNKHLVKGINEIWVRADHSKVWSARWYTGSGIYRHVWLNVRNPTHVNSENLQLTFEHLPGAANVRVKYDIENTAHLAGAVTVKSSVITPQGKSLVTHSKVINLNKQSTLPATENFAISKPQMWDIDAPSLYKLQVKVLKDGHPIDTYTLPFGIRKTEFSGLFGFKLNGRNIKIKGVCMHTDAGHFGDAVPDEVLLARLKQLKEMGVNAIRTSHNPFAPEFYTLCDKLGLMVLNEAFDGWEKEKAPDDYGNYFEDWWQRDLTDFITRDRNHPSVIMWSIGNEVRNPTSETQAKLIDLIHTLDPGRPVTQGGVDPTRGMNDKDARTRLDIKGFNGDGEEKEVYEKFHAKFPEVPMIGTEVPHTYQTRGFYHTTTTWRRRDFPAPWEIASGQAGTMKNLEGRVFPIPDLTEKDVFPEMTATSYYKNDSVLAIPNDKPWAKALYYQSSYDNASVRSSARKAWQRTEELPYVMGQFRWTGFDYLGESNQWPSRFANFGVIDLCGFPKDHFYLYQSLWTSKPMVHMLPHWTHPGKEGTVIPVVIYTNCDNVELTLNGRSLGNKKYEGEQLVWNVPYQPGTIKATAYVKGKAVATEIYNTAGKAAVISLKPRETSMAANNKDVLICEATVTDANGVPVPQSREMLKFKVTGPAQIKATDNGDPLDMSDASNPKRRAFSGKCIVILKSTGQKGTITLTASGAGLNSTAVRITSK